MIHLDIDDATKNEDTLMIVGPKDMSRAQQVIGSWIKKTQIKPSTGLTHPPSRQTPTALISCPKTWQQSLPHCNQERAETNANMVLPPEMTQRHLETRARCHACDPSKRAN